MGNNEGQTSLWVSICFDAGGPDHAFQNLSFILPAPNAVSQPQIGHAACLDAWRLFLLNFLNFSFVLPVLHAVYYPWVGYTTLRFQPHMSNWADKEIKSGPCRRAEASHTLAYSNFLDRNESIDSKYSA